VNVITKFLVAFAAILAVALSALTIAYATNAERIAEDYRNEQARRIDADTRLSAVQTNAALERATLQDQLQDVQEERSDLAQTVRSLEAELADLRTAKAKAENETAAIRNQIGQFEATIGTQAALIEAYRNEVTELRQAELAWNRREIEILEALNDRDGRIEVLEVTNRALQEELKDLELALQAASTGTETMAGGPVTTTIRPVSGRVLSTMVEEATGRTLVEIDLGENDGVEEGMVFGAHRSGNFLANLIIVRTDLQTSVARVDPLDKASVDIRVNDQVASTFR